MQTICKNLKLVYNDNANHLHVVGGKMKKLFLITIVSTLFLGLSACTKIDADIVTTSFIGYDLATQIAGEKLEVVNIMPWGSEMHDFEPTPKDISGINRSRLFIFLGVLLEPWVANNVNQDNALNLSESYHIEPHDHGDDHSYEDHFNHDEDHDHGSLHYWTDPVTYLQLIEVVRDRIIAIDPANKSYYEHRAQTYYERIEALHFELDEYTASLDNRLLFFAGHNALYAFADRYHLEIRSLTGEYKPNADLTPQQLQKLRDEIVASDVHHLFIEELVEPRVARSIQNMLSNQNYSLEILELHGYHNISQTQLKKGVTYADLFEQNIRNIEQALGN